MNSQEKKLELKPTNTFQTGIGVVDMKNSQSINNYQSIVEQFEDIRRKHRNTFTKQEDVIRDEEQPNKRIFCQKKFMQIKSNN